MITKKRLEELIEQGATIYYIKIETFVAGYSNFISIKEIELYSPIQCKILEKYYNNEDYLIVKYGNGTDYFLPYNLFETKEEAEWELEFGNITRTETLRLPRWEEFELLGHDVDFIGEDKTPYYFRLNYNKSEIYITNFTNGKAIYCAKATKENYIEACKLCKKLFLGEEV